MQSHWQGVGGVVNIQVCPLDSNVRVGETKAPWLSKLTRSSVRLVEAPPGSPVGPCSPGGLALPNTYLSFRPHSYSGNSVKKVVYQEKGRQSGRESCVSGTSRAQEVPGLYLSSSPSSGRDRGPQPRCMWPSPVVQPVSLLIAAPGHQSLWDRGRGVRVSLNPPPPK